jgi:hypothetical protein
MKWASAHAGLGRSMNEEAAMEDLDRRSALAFGLFAAGGIAFPCTAVAGTHEPDRGTEIAPGVRQIELGYRISGLPGYKAISMRDLVFQPGTNTYDPSTPNDMVCQLIEGYLRVRHGGSEWIAHTRTGPWAFQKAASVAYRNLSPDPATVRVIDLIAL